MAQYLVMAQPKKSLIIKLEKLLREGTFKSLRPFGKSLTYSLTNAKIQGDGFAVWEEEDYCSPPLAQEREAVLDEYFDDLTVTAVEEGEGWKSIEKLPRLFKELGD